MNLNYLFYRLGSPAQAGAGTDWIAANGNDELATLRRARRLGWFSVALGLAQLAAPKLLAGGLGLRHGKGSRQTMRLLGLREVIAGVGILARPRPSGFLWARVAGDAMDLALLAAAPKKRGGRERLVVGGLSLLALTALDAFAARKVQRTARAHAGSEVEQTRLRHTQAITVNLSYDEASQLWQSFHDESKSVIERVRYETAPGDRGTELHVTHATLDAIRARNVLRRFKQVAETGEVLHSDASIHKGLHAAQPSKQSMLNAKAQSAKVEAYR